MRRSGNIEAEMPFAAVRFLTGGLGVLPRPLAVKAGLALGHSVYRFARGARSAAERNLELAFPEMDERARKRLLRGSFKNVGRLIGEFSQLPGVTKERLHDMVEFDQVALEHVKAAAAEGRGVILVSCHLGPWELSLVAWSALQYPLNIIARPFNDPRVGEYMGAIRTRFGNRMISEKGAIREAVPILKQGGTVAMGIDVNMPRDIGVFVSFFGRLACTTPGVALLALLSDALVLPVCIIWRDDRKRYFLHSEPPVDLLRTGDNVRDIEVNTARYTAAIEKMVRAYPDQYLWMHRRWLTRPKGEAELYESEVDVRRGRNEIEVSRGCS
jgi:Kdo2-lipid IVA lauroyltransferase/acyltransferase